MNARWSHNARSEACFCCSPHFPQLARAVSSRGGLINPDVVLAELLQLAFAAGVLEQPWRGRAIELQAVLTERSFGSARLASELLQYPAAVGRYLGRIIQRRAEFEREYGLDVECLGQVKGVERYAMRREETVAQADLSRKG